MSTHVEEHTDLCTGFALGTLEDGDHKRLMEHLRTCEACNDRVDACNDALVTVARAAPPADPPAVLRSKVMADALAFSTGDVARAQEKREVEVHTSSAMSWKGWLAIWAALVLTFALIASRNEIAQLRRELADSQAMMARATQAMTEGVFWGQIVNAPGARVAWMDTGSPAAPRGWVTVEPGNGHVAALFTHVNPPAGHDYVLWAMRGDRPTRLGVLSAGSSGRAALRHPRVAGAATISGFQLSLEPADAAVGEAPTGRIVAGARVAGG